jgi:hypothetical protein
MVTESAVGRLGSASWAGSGYSRGMGTNEAGLCVCGHERRAHEHYRAGADCSLCADPRCPRFRPVTPWWRRLLGAR